MADIGEGFGMDGMGMTKDFEGFEPNVYKDSRGYDSIGYGFNLEAYPKAKTRNMTRKMADEFFVPVYKNAEKKAMKFSGNRWESLTPKQKAIVTDMSYNLGDKLFDFKDMRKAMMSGDDMGVVREMKDSDWYRQVGRRSKHHVKNWASNENLPAPSIQSSPNDRSFAEAFAEARSGGLKEFQYKGKPYNTRTK